MFTGLARYQHGRPWENGCLLGTLFRPRQTWRTPQSPRATARHCTLSRWNSKERTGLSQGHPALSPQCSVSETEQRYRPFQPILLIDY